MLRNNITYSTEIFVRKQITQTLEQIQRYSRKRNELSPKIPIRISILARKNYSTAVSETEQGLLQRRKGCTSSDTWRCRHVRALACVCRAAAAVHVRARYVTGSGSTTLTTCTRTVHEARRPSNFENSHNFDCDFAPSDWRTPSFFRFVILRNDRFNRERERERENCWKNLYLFLCILLRVVSNIEILHVSKFWVYWTIYMVNRIGSFD